MARHANYDWNLPLVVFAGFTLGWGTGLLVDALKSREGRNEVVQQDQTECTPQEVFLDTASGKWFRCAETDTWVGVPILLDPEELGEEVIQHLLAPGFEPDAWANCKLVVRPAEEGKVEVDYLSCSWVLSGGEG